MYKKIYSLSKITHVKTNNSIQKPDPCHLKPPQAPLDSITLSVMVTWC